MLRIKRIVLNNFKKFTHLDVEMCNNISILVGNNGAGKSTILQAMDLALSGSQYRVESAGLVNLFNKDVIEEYIYGEKEYDKLPIIYIELYLEGGSVPELNGKNNSSGIACDGVRLTIEPDPDYEQQIRDILSREDDELFFPFEYYKYEFIGFSGLKFNAFNKPVRYTVIKNVDGANDGTANRYVLDLYDANIDLRERVKNEHKYRAIRDGFARDCLYAIDGESNVNFGFKHGQRELLRNNITIYENNIPLEYTGDGERCAMKIKKIIETKADSIDLIMIEEPENHLSATSLRKLLCDISGDGASISRQLILTTHSSKVCSRLDLRNIIAIGDDAVTTSSLKQLDESTADFFIKCPTDSLLELVLANKVMLVEGAAEYILMDEMFRIASGESLSDAGVSVISVNGLSFERYIKVAQSLNKKCAIITDNDGNYAKNIEAKYSDYNNDDNIKIYADGNDERYTFEVCVCDDNVSYLDDKNIAQTDNIADYALGNKSEFAYRLLCELENDDVGFEVPDYIKEAAKWMCQ